MPRRPKPPAPVGVDELKAAILRMIVEKFGDRPLNWETVEAALREVNYEAKMPALCGGPMQGRAGGPKR
jgi:hypothetical protein